jgi:hypothetical protein
MDNSIIAASLFSIIFGIAIGLFFLIAEWKIYTKAGKPGWAVIVPIYNMLILLEIIGKPWWWLLLMLIPGVNIVFCIWAINLLSKSFGKDTGFTIGLLILPIIFLPMLGFGSATYVGPAGEASAA